jgi:MOB kinase activator 1
MEGFLGGMFKAAGSPRGQAAAPTGAGGRPTAGAGAGAGTTGTGRQQQLHHYTRKTLGMGFIRMAVELPAGVDPREWLALHCQDFFDSLSLLVGVAAAADEGSPRLEPGFGFPPGYEYLWMDPRTRRPIKCSGPDYIDHVLEWVSSVLNDARLFPAPGTAASGPEAYPPGFEKTAKAVFKRLFRIFAILYTHYYQRMDAMGAVAHLNTR